MLPTMETALLRQKVELLEQIIQGIENERNDLRRRLDAESEARESAAEIHRLTLMLTHLPLTIIKFRCQQTTIPLMAICRSLAILAAC